MTQKQKIKEKLKTKTD